RRGHFFASLVSLGRVVPLEAEPVTHGVGSVTDGIARCLAGLSDRVGGIADSVHDTARIDAHVEADLATDAESDTQRGTQMELPIVTHAELGAGLDPGAGPGLTAHTGTDTGHLGTDLAGDSRPGEGLGSDVHTGQTDAAFRRRRRSGHGVATGRHAGVVSEVHLTGRLDTSTGEGLRTALGSEGVHTTLGLGGSADHPFGLTTRGDP